MAFRVLLLPVMLAALSACQTQAVSDRAAAPPADPPAASTEIGYPQLDGGVAPPPPGFDPAAFEAFIAERPTREEFAARYPDILLVLPEMMVTREYRMDYSRFFPSWDDDGRVAGGSFQ